MSSEENKPLLKPGNPTGLTLDQYAKQLRAEGHNLAGFKYTPMTDIELDTYWKEAHARACFASQGGFKSVWRWTTSKEYREKVTMQYFEEISVACVKEQLQAYIARP
jgi:hypothetical protein